jgi:cell wall-associated NlpC family hydrolase
MRTKALLAALGIAVVSLVSAYTHSAHAQSYLSPAELQYQTAPTYTTYSAGPAAKSIVRQARYYVRKEKPYDPQTWSCSDFTRASVGYGVGVWMPDWDDAQLAYGRPTTGLRDPLKRGDLVFFREHGGVGKVSHVSIYAGGGYVLHSSAYWGYSTKTAMMYIEGYIPEYTRRIRPRLIKRQPAVT